MTLPVTGFEINVNDHNLARKFIFVQSAWHD